LGLLQSWKEEEAQRNAGAKILDDDKLPATVDAAAGEAAAGKAE
jgi:hypothetical protein